MFGKTNSKYSIGQKMSFKLIAISPANNNSSYQLPTRYPKFEKVGATPPLQKLKITLVLVNDLKTY